MTTNQYFSDLYTSNQHQQVLVDDLIIECIQIHGRDMYYLPRDLTNFDSFFGEDQTSSFKEAMRVEFYLENIQSWQDEGAFVSKFGMELRDSATFAVSIKRFKDEITSIRPDISRPREGDILVFPSPFDNRKRLMEITFVKNEEIFYQVGKLYIYTVTVKNFEYSGEKFDTGHMEIDDYELTHALTTTIVCNESDGIPFQIGETVSQVTGWSGIVLSFDGKNLLVNSCTGEYNEYQYIIGDNSSASRFPFKADKGVGNHSNMTDNDYIDLSLESGLSQRQYNPLLD